MRRRLELGINSVNKFQQMTGVSRNAITAIEQGRGSENSRARLEAWLDKYEEDAGWGAGEVLRAAEARDSPPSEEPEVMEFEVEGPSAKWRVHAKATKGNADEAIAAVAKLIHQLREDDGEAEES